MASAQPVSRAPSGQAASWGNQRPNCIITSAADNERLGVGVVLMERLGSDHPDVFSLFPQP